MLYLVVLMCFVGTVLGGAPDNPGNNPRCQTCCCGTVTGDRWDRYPDGRFRCCDTTRYDPEDDTCCNENFQPGFPEKHSRCCGTTAYDPRSYTCCDGNLVEATPTEDQCCSGVAYNQKHDICCNGALHKRTKKSRCCGTEEYNPHNQICCKGALTDGCTHDFRCCFNVGFDPLKQICSDASTGTLEDSPALFVGETTPRSCCLSDESWTPCDDTCCSDGSGGPRVITGTPVTPTTGCCGGQVYDIHEQLCCQEQLAPANINPKKYLCCHNTPYNPHSETCCGSTTPTVVTGVGLCCGNSSVFDPRDQICCVDTVFPGCPSRTKCCFTEGSVVAYDTRRQLCCDGNVVSGGKGWRCCGGTSYNPKHQNCCSGVLFQRDVFRNQEVCNGPNDEG